MYNLLSKSSTTMQSRSDSILNVFNKTITKLTKLAEEASAQASKKEEEIKKAQAEKEALETIASKNLAIAKKFEDMVKL